MAALYSHYSLISIIGHNFFKVIGVPCTRTRQRPQSHISTKKNTIYTMKDRQQSRKNAPLAGANDGKLIFRWIVL